MLRTGQKRTNSSFRAMTSWLWVTSAIVISSFHADIKYATANELNPYQLQAQTTQRTHELMSDFERILHRADRLIDESAKRHDDQPANETNHLSGALGQDESLIGTIAGDQLPGNTPSQITLPTPIDLPTMPAQGQLPSAVTLPAPQALPQQTTGFPTIPAGTSHPGASLPGMPQQVPGGWPQPQPQGMLAGQATQGFNGQRPTGLPRSNALQPSGATQNYAAPGGLSMQAPAQPFGTAMPPQPYGSNAGNMGMGNPPALPGSQQAPIFGQNTLSNQLGPAQNANTVGGRQVPGTMMPAPTNSNQFAPRTQSALPGGMSPAPAMSTMPTAQPSAQNFVTMNAPVQANQPSIGRMLDQSPRPSLVQSTRPATMPSQTPGVTRPDLRGLRAMAPSAPARIDQAPIPGIPGVQGFQEGLARLNATADAMARELSLAQEETSILRGKLSARDQSINELKEKLQSEKQWRNAIDHELAALAESIRDEEIQKKRTDQRVIALEQAYRGAETALQEERQQNQRMNAELSHLRSTLASISPDQAQDATLISELRAQRDALAAQVDSLSFGGHFGTGVESYGQSMSFNGTEANPDLMTNLDRQLSALRQEKDLLNGDLANTHARLQEMEVQILQREQVLVEMQQKIAQQTEQLAILRQAVSERDLTIQAQQIQLNQQSSDATPQLASASSGQNEQHMRALYQALTGGDTDGPVTELPDQAPEDFFVTDRLELNEKGIETLNNVAEQMRSWTDDGGKLTVMSLTSPYSANGGWEVAAARAITITRYLTARGVSHDRLLATAGQDAQDNPEIAESDKAPSIIRFQFN